MNNNKPVIHHHGLDFLKRKLAPKQHHSTVHGDIHTQHHERLGNTGDDSHTYYWIWASENGHKIVWGPYNSNEEAQRRGYGKLHCYFEVVPLHTKDTGTASQMLRARMLDSTGDISESFKRFSHKES